MKHFEEHAGAYMLAAIALLCAAWVRDTFYPPEPQVAQSEQVELTIGQKLDALYNSVITALRSEQEEYGDYHHSNIHDEDDAGSPSNANHVGTNIEDGNHTDVLVPFGRYFGRLGNKKLCFNFINEHRLKFTSATIVDEDAGEYNNYKSDVFNYRWEGSTLVLSNGSGVYGFPSRLSVLKTPDGFTLAHGFSGSSSPIQFTTSED